MIDIPKEAYLQEYKRLVGVACQDKALRDLLGRYPDSDVEVRQALFSANVAVPVSETPTRMLSVHKLNEIGDRRPGVYQRILPVYTKFLAEKMGLG